MLKTERIPVSRMKTAFAFFMICSLMFAVGAAAETMYVKKSGTKLRQADSAKSETLKTLAKGTSVGVVQKKGKFYLVSAGDDQGWIFKFKLTSTAPASGGGVLEGLVGSQKVAASGSASGSSIRGLSPVSEDHAKSKGIAQSDIDAVKKMESQTVGANEVEQFLAGRKLGEYAE